MFSTLLQNKNAPPLRECKGNTNFSKKENLFYFDLVLDLVYKGFRRLERWNVVRRNNDGRVLRDVASSFLSALFDHKTTEPT
jgi:hypothetical protein